jgi:hypothetical protein
VGQLVALAAGAGATRISLHHYIYPGGGSADVEDGVAAAFAGAAAEHGERCGCTLLTEQSRGVNRALVATG